MAVVPFKKARRRRSIRYYLPLDDGLFRVPLRLMEEIAAGEVAIPEFANSVRRMVEVLIEEAGRQTKLRVRGTSSRYDAEGKVDLHHAAEAISTFLAGWEPTQLSPNVVDIQATLNWRRSEREGKWRPPASVVAAVRADIAGAAKLPSFPLSRIRR